jgi:hypothetical protein
VWKCPTTDNVSSIHLQAFADNRIFVVYGLYDGQIGL